MSIEPNRRPSGVDFAALYDGHGEYAARRVAGSFEQEQVLLETTGFKIPNLMSLLPPGLLLRSVLEIGCATGELIANFPVAPGGRRVGCDISVANVAAASARYPETAFLAGDFADLSLDAFDVVVLSDVLEHVEDDSEFLRRAARLGRHVLVNLPLEDNWLNRNRRYGPDDASGHLRFYTEQEGLNLFARAGLGVRNQRRVWIHELEVDTRRREMRRQHFGQGYSGALATRAAKAAALGMARAVRPLGRWLFASNLFALADGRAS